MALNIGFMIYLPFLVMFLPRADQPGTGWVFQQAPRLGQHQEQARRSKPLLFRLLDLRVVQYQVAVDFRTHLAQCRAAEKQNQPVCETPPGWAESP